MLLATVLGGETEWSLSSSGTIVRFLAGGCRAGAGAARLPPFLCAFFGGLTERESSSSDIRWSLPPMSSSRESSSSSSLSVARAAPVRFPLLVDATSLPFAAVRALPSRESSSRSSRAPRPCSLLARSSSASRAALSFSERTFENCQYTLSYPSQVERTASSIPLIPSAPAREALSCRFSVSLTKS